MKQIKCKGPNLLTSTDTTLSNIADEQNGMLTLLFFISLLMTASAHYKKKIMIKNKTEIENNINNILKRHWKAQDKATTSPNLMDILTSAWLTIRAADRKSGPRYVEGM